MCSRESGKGVLELKTWMNSDVRRKLYERASAFKSGDAVKYKTARYSLKRSIKEAKRAYGKRIEGHFTGNDPRQMWEGLGAITSYKPRGAISAGGDLTPDQLNTFYSRFDALNTETPVFRPSLAPIDPRARLTLTVHEVRRVMSRVNVRKAAGPDGIPPRAVKDCRDQLAPVFTDIYNMSLERSLVPKCFKESVNVPIPKKSPVKCPGHTTCRTHFHL